MSRTLVTIDLWKTKEVRSEKEEEDRNATRQDVNSPRNDGMTPRLLLRLLLLFPISFFFLIPDPDFLPVHHHRNHQPLLLLLLPLLLLDPRNNLLQQRLNRRILNELIPPRLARLLRLPLSFEGVSEGGPRGGVGSSGVIERNVVGRVDGDEVVGSGEGGGEEVEGGDEVDSLG